MSPPIPNNYSIHPSARFEFAIGSFTVGAAALAVRSSSPIMNIIGSSILIQTGVDVLNHYTMRCRTEKLYRVPPNFEQPYLNTNNRLITAIFAAICNSYRNIALSVPSVLSARTGFQNAGQICFSTLIPGPGAYYGIKNWGKFSLIPRLNPRQMVPFILAQAVLAFSISYFAGQCAEKFFTEKAKSDVNSIEESTSTEPSAEATSKEEPSKDPSLSASKIQNVCAPFVTPILVSFFGWLVTIRRLQLS